MALSALIDPQWVSPSIAGIILGSILVLLGVTGGDSEIKEIRIPKVEGFWRGASLVSGVLLFLLGAGVIGHIASSPAQGSKSQSDTSGATGATAEGKHDAVQQTAATAQQRSSVSSEGNPEQKSQTSQQPPTATLITPPAPAPREPVSTIASQDTDHPGPRAQVEVTADNSEGVAWEQVDVKVGLDVHRLSTSQASPHASATFDVPRSGNVNYKLTLLVKTSSGAVGRYQGTGRINAEDSHTFEVIGRSARVYLTPNRGHLP